jgi:hypothetical protein
VFAFLIFVAPPEARADLYGVSAIDYSTSTGVLSGFSMTYADWFDWTPWWICNGEEEWDEDYQQWYCTEWGYYSLFPTVSAGISAPSGAFYSLGTTFGETYAEADYSIYPNEYGTWATVASHNIGRGDYYQLCFSAASWDCYPLTLWITEWFPIGATIATVQRRPVIAATDTTLWYFGGENPAGWKTSITLTSSAGAATTWSITQTDDKVDLFTPGGNPTNAGENVVAWSSGTHFSTSVGDIKVVATSNGASSLPYSITSRTPTSTTRLADQLMCGGDYRYTSLVLYRLRDNLNDVIIPIVAVNEEFGAPNNDYSPPTNWRQSNVGVNGSTQPGVPEASGSLLVDTLGGEAIGYHPDATCGLGLAAVQHWSQIWRIGHPTSGRGKVLLEDTIRKFLGSATHSVP